MNRCLIFVSFSYMILDYQNKFTIDERTGIITLAASLDYETKTEHKFAVKVKDNGIPEMVDETTVRFLFSVLQKILTCTQISFMNHYLYTKYPIYFIQVIISVTDVNDCRPKLQPYDVYLNESRYDNKLLGAKLSVRDNDGSFRNREVVYSVVEDTKDMIVNKNTGELYINTTLDYEHQIVYVYRVRATNTGEFQILR